MIVNLLRSSLHLGRLEDTTPWFTQYVFGVWIEYEYKYNNHHHCHRKIVDRKHECVAQTRTLCSANVILI